MKLETSKFPCVVMFIIIQYKLDKLQATKDTGYIHEAVIELEAKASRGVAQASNSITAKCYPVTLVACSLSSLYYTQCCQWLLFAHGAVAYIASSRP